MSKTKVWVTGSQGNLGRTISSLLDNERYDLMLSDKDIDITEKELVHSYMELNRPDIVINCAGISDAYECEKNLVKAYKVNTLGAGNLAASSRKIGAGIIHISTDDVFSGNDTNPLTEFDIALPSTIYGKSKLAGENYVREFNPRHLIVRSSWVYGGGAKEDFVISILNQAKISSLMYVPNVQISSPTSAIELSDFIVKLMEYGKYGTYHASCEGSCTRYDFAKTILELAGIKDVYVLPSRSEHIDNSPRYTLLRNLMMEITGIYKMPDWKIALKEYLDEKVDYQKGEYIRDGG